MGIGRIELVSCMAEGKKEGLGRAVEICHLKKKVLLLSEPKIEGARVAFLYERPFLSLHALKIRNL